MRSHNLERLGHSPAPRYDIFRNDQPLARGNRESPSKDQPALPILFHKNVPQPEVTGYLLPYDNSAHCGGNHGLRAIRCEAASEESAHLGGEARVLKQESTLEEFPAVQAGAQDKMPAKKCS